MRDRLFCPAFFALYLPLTAAAQLVGLPKAPDLSPAGFALILEFETGGRAGYNPRPEWPGYASGVTVGIGYDLGYNSVPVIRKDWLALSYAEHLATAAGVTGSRAKPLAVSLRSVLVPWDLAGAVFSDVTVARFYALTARTFRGLEELHPDAQAALVSLVFNRGSSLIGPRRSEMRSIASAVSRRDYAEISRQLRAMRRHWVGSDIERGMTKRREAEARLVEAAAKEN